MALVNLVVRQTCEFFVVHSNSSGWWPWWKLWLGKPVSCLSFTQTAMLVVLMNAVVWQSWRSAELLSHWRVSRPGLCSVVLMGGTVLLQMLPCHWRCAAGAHFRLTSMALGQHGMSQSAVACPHFHKWPHWPSCKASASRAEDPGFESRLCRDFFEAESYQWLQNWHSSGYPVRCLAS